MVLSSFYIDATLSFPSHLQGTLAVQDLLSKFQCSLLSEEKEKIIESSSDSYLRLFTQILNYTHISKTQNVGLEAEK